jgi:beta-mannosidase
MNKKLIFLFFMMLENILTAQNTISLNNDWRFKMSNFKPNLGLNDEWLPVNAPVSIHTALMEKGLIPDLFYRDNESKFQWIEKEDWVFDKNFDLPADVLKNEHIELNFKGLDTHADVFLNGKLILKANNAFRSWKVDVKDILQEKNNFIRIYFYSAVKHDEYLKDAGGIFPLPGIPTNERVYSRKPQFHYGWDWGPRFVNCGISKAIELTVWNEVVLREVNIKQVFLSNEEAVLQADMEIESSQLGEQEISFEIDNQVFTKKINIVQQGLNVFTIENIRVKNPRRWWSNGLGEAYLYSTKTILNNGEKNQTISKKIGLRTLKLVREKDKIGESFYFELNGVPVFAKGANYIPISVFSDKAKHSDYESLIEDATAANMNMLRVWGGGIYENDEFYDLCDEKGIMVWQDFMYACAMYPGDAAFFENAEKEAIENVRRLRNHACIAVWCGNNEINEAWHNWGWQIQFTLVPKRKEAIWKDYKTLFMSILPKVVQENGNGTAYWESSPSYSRFNPKADSEGDSHYWGIWHDEEPFEQFRQRVPRFMSEYGFQSFPEWKTILTFTEEQDRGLETPVMTVHQKHPRGNTLIRKYMDREYHVPKKFEDFVYVSQILQADGMRRGIEAHRSAMPYCMGTLYWQLNDVWQVASWSGIDGLGRWKALHYAVKNAFAPILISSEKKGKNLDISIVSDLLEDVQGDIQIQVFDFQGHLISSHDEKHKTIKANSSKEYAHFAIANLLNGHSSREVFALIRLKNNEKTSASSIYYFEYPKNLKLPTPQITHQIEATPNGYKVILHSKTLVKNVFIQTEALGKWSDNYFDLLPNETKTIEFTLKSGDFYKDFLIKSLTDTY